MSASLPPWVIGTRFYGQNPDQDLPRLAQFLTAAQALDGARVLVALNTAQDQTDSLAFIHKNYPAVEAFAVTPWRFCAALNELVYRAASMQAQRLLLMSAEFAPRPMQVAALMQQVDANTLVAGARFSAHQFKPGQVVGDGLTVPWNTCALWNLAHLAKLGFPLLGDAAFDPTQAGVEEVAAIAYYQQLFPALQAKLIDLGRFDQDWDNTGWDSARRMQHERKMQSKLDRPAAQLAWARLAAPRIVHIEQDANFTQERR